MDTSKGKCPFYPGQPAPKELFVGRKSQIERILIRGVNQVALGKPIAQFIQGEYGIGKSSIAGYVQELADIQYHLHGIYAPLGGAQNLNDVMTIVLGATVQSGALELKRSEKIRNWLAKYIGKQDLFGQITLNFDALHQDAPSISSPYGMLGFLSEIVKRLQENGIKGIFLVLDEINGITSKPEFAFFLKGLVDTNALSREPVPLLLMLCGVVERRWEMIHQHQPVDRIFDIVTIESMSQEEMEEFFVKAFQSAQIILKPEALQILCRYSAGFPKIMHMVGDSAYWIDRDGIIDENDATHAVLSAAIEIGEKYINPQINTTLRSSDYHSILDKIAKIGPDRMSFTKSELESGLSESEKRKFNNFLQKMKRMNVIRSGDIRGEYVFNMRMGRLYFWLQSIQKDKRLRN